MVSRNLEQGIQAIQNGNHEEGGRLVKIALRDQSIAPDIRAVAYLWLAETQSDVEFKIDCYRKALQANPNNTDAQQRLSFYMSQQLPPTEAPSAQQYNQPPQNPQVQQPNNRNMPPDNNQYGQQRQPDFNEFWQGGNNVPPTQQPPQQGGYPQNQQYNQPPQQQSNFWQQNQQPPPQQQGDYPQNRGQADRSYQYPQQNQPPEQKHQPDFWDSFSVPQGGTNMMDTRQLQAANTNYQQQQFPQQPTIMLQRLQRTVGVIGGPNGDGTGFFLTRDGLIATTRFIVGGATRLTILLEDGRQAPGEVVRTFPSFDLALIKANIHLQSLIRVDRNPNIPDGMPLVAATHSGQGLRSQKRATRQRMEAHWIPTLINHLLDAGGNPIFNDQNALVGMLTKNASRSNGYLYGLHISKIIQCAGQYTQEKQQTVGDTAYCDACGIISKAPNLGGFFCENCGNTLPFAKDLARYPQRNMISIYGENHQRPCPNCQSQVGFYKGECMRCGFEL